jgi:hypothetical protein
VIANQIHYLFVVERKHILFGGNAEVLMLPPTATELIIKRELLLWLSGRLFYKTEL